MSRWAQALIAGLVFTGFGPALMVWAIGVMLGWSW